MDGNSILIGLIAGTIGTGYLAYGKKQGRTVPMISGALLIVYSYLTDNVWVLLIVGAALCAAPFVIKE